MRGRGAQPKTVRPITNRRRLHSRTIRSSDVRLRSILGSGASGIVHFDVGIRQAAKLNRSDQKQDDI